MIDKVFFLVLIATAIICIDALHPFLEEKECLTQNGLCTLITDCPKFTKSGKDLCPQQKRYGAICCNPELGFGTDRSDGAERRDKAQNLENCYWLGNTLICPEGRN